MQKHLDRTETLDPRTELHRFASAEQGMAAPELGIITPVLVILALGIVDFGMATYRSMQINNAAQAGAYYAMLNGMDMEGIKKAVLNATSSTSIELTPSPASFCGCPKADSVETVACGTACSGGLTAGQYISVSTRTVHSTIFHYPFIPEKMTFTAQSTVRLP